ncbi:flagellar export chaperone FliS [Pseudomonas sp. LRF_L74]|uniref:flagellar export chaperone FliS n=1 Tax=Pseudomonas sp. LRF_L74 TaxID=3369422 RepID=UPI003F622761
MNATLALRQYQVVDVQSQIYQASPHRLIQMLMEGALTRMYQAKGALERGQMAAKAQLIGKTIYIVGGLRDSLDLKSGGELAERLAALYAYMHMCLLQANLHNDPGKLEEACDLLQVIKSGWDGIEPQV